jgi:hypothetical protein
MPRMDVREELIKAAGDGRTITYGYLMKKFRVSRGHPRGVGIAEIIGSIDRYEQERGAPGFGAIVVRKDTGYPGGGYFCYDDLSTDIRRSRDQRASPRLSEKEKRHIEAEQRKIWKYYARHLGDGHARRRDASVPGGSRGAVHTDDSPSSV